MKKQRFEAVIGLEVHAQLATESKIFSGSSTAYGGSPNSQTDPVVLGLPGVLPVLNQRAVEFAIRIGLAANCTIARRSQFARKHYFYPDLPKGYQISQFDDPICQGGYIEIETRDGEPKKIRLNRIHMEEDAGKSVHDPAIAGSETLIDLNRSGVPLVEIVSEPDLRTAQEANAYLQKLHQLVTYLQICDGNMEEGSFRCDANVSVRLAGETQLGVKTELKNMNSFRNVEQAIQYEIDRQIGIVSQGKRVVSETLLWDADAATVRSMRSKEEAHDYRYFPEPDLPILNITPEWVAGIRSSLPELPDVRKKRFEEIMGLSAYDAGILSDDRDLADYFEAVVNEGAEMQLAANWVINEALRTLKERKLAIRQYPLSAKRFAGLLKLISKKTISAKIARDIYEMMLDNDQDALAIVKAKALGQISDENELAGVVEKIVADNQEQAEQFRNGKDKLLSFFVGQAMKATRGKADPAIVNRLLLEKLRE